MTIEGSSIAVPGGTRLVGALAGGSLLLHLRDPASLAVLDPETIELSPWRAFPGLQSARNRGAWIALDGAAGPALVRADLQGEAVSVPAALSITAVAGSIALLTGSGTWMLFDLARRAEVARGTDKAFWYSAHEGLFLGVRERGREIVALRAADGAIAWTAKPFTTKVDSLGHPRGHGDEIHIRASGVHDAFVARLAAADGTVRGLRKAPDTLDSWLPDLGESVDRALAPFTARTSFVEGDALVVLQHDQALVARATGLARVALPSFAQTSHALGRIVGLVSNRDENALVVVPLPASGEHDVVLVPKAAAAPAATAVAGKVSFASGSVVIVQHPTYGRVTLTTQKSPLPKAGDDVILDGVELRPGGVVKVERWWVAGARAAREPVRIGLVPAKRRSADDGGAGGERPAYIPDLILRSDAAKVAIPAEVLHVVAHAEMDPAFREALGSLGFRFGPDFSGADVVEDLDVEGFLPIWSDGHGDTFGGLTATGTLAYLHVKDGQTIAPLAPPSFVAHIRELANDSELEASAELVLAMLTSLDVPQ